MNGDVILRALEKILGVPKEQICLEIPGNQSFGDYSTNVALKFEGLNAWELVDKLQGDKELMRYLEKIETKGPGFINFWIKKDILVDNLIDIVNGKDSYGSSEIGKGSTVIVDYSSPNIAKPFGIGHLRSTIVGQALYNLYRILGYEVVGDNHLGDWGTQFGALLAEIQNSGFEIQDLTIEKMEQMYVDFHKKADDHPGLKQEARDWFKKLEDGDKKAREIWQKCVDVSLSEFNKIYELLGVKIDFTYGESYYRNEMKLMMEDNNVKKYLTRGNDRSWIIDLTKFGIRIPLMFLKSDGTSTYATRDLATIRFRVRKWKNLKKIIYEAGVEQSLHFSQVFAASRLLGLISDDVELVHTSHGLYLAPDGRKFSTRKGKTIKLEDVLNEAVERAKKLGNKTDKAAKMVGIGAIKYFDLMHSVQSNVVFDWEKIMNMEGNSGPYLQYTFARTQSVLRKVRIQESKIEISVQKLKAGELELNNQEMILMRFLARYPEIIITAAKSYSPNLLCSYLYELASKFNTFYNSNRIIINSNHESGGMQDFRIVLTAATGQIIKNGLNILGIESPERM
jgi:arginyl-tRNA synthetase